MADKTIKIYVVGRLPCHETEAGISESFAAGPADSPALVSVHTATAYAATSEPQ
jgi:hypothetical protein